MSREEKIRKVAEALMQARGWGGMPGVRHMPAPRPIVTAELGGTSINVRNKKAPPLSFREQYTDANFPKDKYPDGVPADQNGRLLRDMDNRNDLGANLVPGLRNIGGDNVSLTQEDISSLGNDWTGAPITRKPAQANDPGEGWLNYNPGVGREFEIVVQDHVKGDKLKEIEAHEVPHIINHLAGRTADWTPERARDPKIYVGIPTDTFGGQPSPELEKQLKKLYHLGYKGEVVVNNFFTPEKRGYHDPVKQKHELMANAIRIYMENPKLMKSIAPLAAEQIRWYVNSSPWLNKKIQFNRVDPSLIGPAGRGQGSSLA